MSKRNLSQSPRAMRESTNDPEAHAIGKVQLEHDSSDRSKPVIEEFSKQDRDGSGWAPTV